MNCEVTLCIVFAGKLYTSFELDLHQVHTLSTMKAFSLGSPPDTKAVYLGRPGLLICPPLLHLALPHLMSLFLICNNLVSLEPSLFICSEWQSLDL